MGLFEHFPYTNFHELNIDWLLRELKKAGAQIEDLEKFIHDLDIPEDVKQIMDEWLEDGTIEDLIEEAVEEALDKELLHPDKVQLHTFLTTSGRTTGTVYGDCILVTGSVNGIIDFGYDPAIPALRHKIQDLEITKLDFVVISHYHNDHITDNFPAALGNLIGTGVDLSHCVFYLPHKGIDWSLFQGPEENWSARESAVKGAITGQGLTWVEPANLQEVELTTGIKMRFSNIGDYTDYYTYDLSQNNVPMGHTMYNCFSMVTELYVYDRVILFAGDITQVAQEKLAGLYDNVEVYKIEHHGLETYCPDNWLNSFSPKYVLLCNYSGLYLDDNNTPQYLLRPCLTAKLNQGATLLQSQYDAVVEVSYEGSKVLEGVGFQGGIIGRPVRQMLHYGDDLNDILYPGAYCTYNAAMSVTLDNVPYNWGAFRLEVEELAGANAYGRIQKVYPNSGTYIGYWFRLITESTVGDWRYIETSDFTALQPTT